MALSGYFSTNKYSTSNHGTIGLYFSWTGTQNIANNTTTIKWLLMSSGTMSSSYYVQAGPVVVTINGTKVLNTTSRFNMKGGGAYKKTGSITVAHGTDGSKTVAMSVKAAIYSTSVNCTGSKNYVLDKIPRGALLDSTPDSINDGEYPTITYTNPLGSETVNNIKTRIKWTGVQSTDYDGPIASFNTNTTKILKRCISDIECYQDLHGYSKPWAAGTGKNIFNIENLNASGTVAGLNYTRTATGINWSGTASNTGWQAVLDITFSETGTYHYKAENVTTERLLRGWSNISNNSSFDFDVTDTSVTYRLALANTTAGQSYSGNISNIMISKGVGEQAYEPYSNVCEITGFEEANISRKGKNLLKNTLEDYHSGNVYWTINEDKSISLSGTASSTVFIPLSNPYYLPSGKYTMSMSGHSGIQMLLRVGTISGADVFWSTELNNRTATITAGSYAPLIRIASGTNTDNITIYPQMEAGEDATDYVNYDEGEVFDVDIRINKGVNIWDEDWESGGIDTDTGLPVTDNSKIRSKNFTEVEPSTDYYFVYKDGNMVVIFYDENYNVISYTGRGLKTTPANCHYVKLRMGSMASPVTEYAYNAGINYPATETFYHAHAGDPVYKGELNVTTGELKVTYGFINMGSLGWSASSYAPGGATTEPKYRYRATDLRNIIKKPSANSVPINAYCDSYAITDANTPYGRPVNDVVCGEVAGEVNVYTSQYATADAVKTGLQGVMLVYELAEPITVHVNRNLISTINGDNNIFSDTGDIDISYYTDGEFATDFVDLSDDGGEYTFTSDTITEQNWSDMMDSCPNSSSLTITYDLQSLMDGSEFHHTKTGIINITDSNPEVVNFSYYDTNPVTVNLMGGNNKKTIQNMSTVRFTFDEIKAKKGATLSEIKVKYNMQDNHDQVASDTSLTGSDIYDFYLDMIVVISSAEDVTFEVELTDSRGNTTKVNLVVLVFPWSRPAINKIELGRRSGFYDDTNIKVTCDYSPLDGNNVLYIFCRWKKTSDESYDPLNIRQIYNDTSANPPLDLDNSYDWDIQVIIYDSVLTSADYILYSYIVRAGTPNVFFDGHRKSMSVNCLPDHDNDIEIDGASVVKRFSNEERCVGFWIDGSKIYEKTISYSSTISSGGNVTVPTATWSQTGQPVDLTLYSTSGTSKIVYKFVAAQINSSGVLQLFNGRAANLTFDAFTIQYTKLT